MGIDARFMVAVVGGLLCCWWGWVHCGFTQVAIDVGGDLVAVVYGCSDSLSQIGFKFWFCFEFLLWVFEFDHGFVYVFTYLDAKKMK